MKFSNDTIQSTKKVVYAAALLNKGVIDTLTTTNLQHKNQFEVLFTPMSLSLKGVANAALDSLITKFYVQNIDISFFSLTYERADNIQYIKDIEYPDTVKITFLENELGSVRNYINSWAKSIAIVDLTGTYTFKDDQDASKRNAMVIPMMKSGLPSGGWIQFKGLKFQSIGELSLSQESPEIMLLDVNFAVDNVWWMTPL